jgi:hypothetical protein
MGWWDNVQNGWNTGGLLGAVGSGLGLVSDRTNNQWSSVDRGNFDMPGYAEQNAYYQQQIGSLGNRDAFTAQDSSFRSDQSQLAQMLMGQARGENSMAAEQLRQAQMSNVAQQQSLAASAMPGQQAMAQRMAMQNAARGGYGMAGQAAMAGIAERQAATQALGGVLQGARGQDQTLGMFNAQMQQGNRQQNDAQIGQMLGLQQQGSMAQQQGGVQYEQQRGQRFTGALGTPTGGEQMMGLGAALGGAALMSDERLKTGIEDASGDADELIAALEPKAWRYKDERHGKGRHVGVMAQALEGTKAGKQAVYETEDGKAVNGARLAAALAAAVGRLGERLDEMEEDA